MSKIAYDDLINGLTSLSNTNFTRLQAAVYIAILQMGEETGSAIAKESGVNRSKIYDILEQLEQMGAITKVSREGKTRYQAVTPSQVFSRISEDFQRGLVQSRETLESMVNLNKDIEPASMTLTTLFLKELNTNHYEYLISSSQKARTIFVEKLSKDFRPSGMVKILNLNDTGENIGLIFLINRDEALIFNTPLGSSVEAIRVSNQKIAQFLLGIITDKWKSDLPYAYLQKVQKGEVRAIYMGKSMYMKYIRDGIEREVYDRPVSFVVTDELIIFFYEGLEAPRIPIKFINAIDIEPHNTIRIQTKFVKGVGDLRIQIADEPIYLRNLLGTLSPLIS